MIVSVPGSSGLWFYKKVGRACHEEQANKQCSSMSLHQLLPLGFFPDFSLMMNSEDACMSSFTAQDALVITAVVTPSCTLAWQET